MCQSQTPLFEHSWPLSVSLCWCHSYFNTWLQLFMLIYC